MKITDEITKKRVFSVLLATMFTVPRADAAQEQKQTGKEPKGTVQVQQMTQQEVIQLLTDEKDPNSIIFCIAGSPKVHFKLWYSETGEEGSYHQLPGAMGVIGENGMARLPINLKKLQMPVIHLKVLTSSNADFSGEVRVTPKPLVIEWSDENIKARGFGGDKKQRGILFDSEPAVAGVRG